MKLKKKHIKLQVASLMKDHNVKVDGERTKDNFFALQLETKSKDTHRIKSLYSYNIFDHPDFMQSQKIEKRIKKYNKKLMYKKLKSQQMQATDYQEEGNQDEQANEPAEEQMP